MQPPASNFDDAPLRCVSINDEWVSFVIGALYRLESPLFWSSDQLHGEQELIQLVDSLVLGECVQPMTYDAYAVMEHSLTLNTNGGGYTATEQTYPLETGQTSDSAKIAISTANDEMTLSPGIYETEASIVVIGDGANATGCKLMVRDLTTPQTFVDGLSQTMAAGQRDVIKLHGVFTVNSSVTVKLRFQANQGRATVGFGSPLNFGTREVYGHWRMNKLLT